MSDKKIHIVSFDIPLPASYGGVIDVFYKLKALSEAGWKIHLHCFMYGRTPDEKLNQYCDQVSYYKRDISKSQLFLRLPYIVSSRSNKYLLEALLKDEEPVFFEGLHCTGLLLDERMSSRKTIVRTHNIEHNYYRHLALAETNLFKRFYFSSEATKLETYEPILSLSKSIAAITQSETDYFNKEYNSKAFYLPAFHPDTTVLSKEGKGDYALYHGNLAIAENHKAAMFLAREVFAAADVNFIVAGNHPKAELRDFIKSKNNIRLIENPDEDELHELIINAQVHTLPTFQATGIKLKLLSALYNGRHVLVNDEMTDGTDLDQLCEKANDAAGFLKKTIELIDVSFSKEKILLRKEILENRFSNHTNALNLEKQILKL